MILNQEPLTAAADLWIEPCGKVAEILDSLGWPQRPPSALVTAGEGKWPETVLTRVLDSVNWDLGVDWQVPKHSERLIRARRHNRHAP